MIIGSSRLEKVDSQNEVDKKLHELADLEFDASRKIERPSPVISMSDAPLSTKQNQTNITGPSKSGKSGVVGSILSGTMPLTGDLPIDTCGLDIRPNSEKGLVLHIDLEQSLYDYDNYIRTIQRRCHRSELPNWFKSYHFRKLDIKKRWEKLYLSIDHWTNYFGSCYLVVIDGIADFVKSVNDEIESRETVAKFDSLAEEYDCPIAHVLHLNPKDPDKSRGHLGSELERKCESVIKLQHDKKSGITTIDPFLLRNAGFCDSLRFHFDTEKGYHVFKEMKSDVQKQSKMEDRMELASRIFRDKNSGLRAKDVKAIIHEIEDVEGRTQSSRIKEMKDLGLIEMRDDNKYYLL